jgi:DNA repair protein RadC
MKIKISEKIKKKPVRSPREVAELLQGILKAEPRGERLKEHFWGVYLNARLNIMRVELITLGIVDANIVHPREVYAPALESRACSLIVAHNHPSGDVEPSQNDLEITKRLVEAGKIMGVEVEDHLIIDEKGNFFSFKEKKLI